MKAMLTFSPLKTPSSFLIADALLLVDLGLKENLLEQASAKGVEDRIC